jgi:hypothetical protein
LKSLWIPILGLIIWALAVGFNSTIERLPIAQLQNQPTWVSIHTDPFWHHLTRLVIQDCSQIRKEVFKLLLKEKRALNTEEDLLDPDEAELTLEGTYQKLPEVYVDQGHGAVFPAPLARPNRFSWFQTTYSGFQTHRHYRSLVHTLSQRKKDNPKERLTAFENQVNRWHQLNSEYVNWVQKVRYLEAWVPQLLNEYQKNQIAGTQPASHAVIQAVFSKNTKIFESLQEVLRPHRVMPRKYLPDVLQPGILRLPVATDIRDRKFLKEIEGALDTHWNQSPWARDQQIQFKLIWKRLPENGAFASGSQTLAQHLNHFPQDVAIMTTGALTTHVRGQALIFGLGKINARTIAHEIGHLLGFSDCYMRTLTDQGSFGLGVLEWDNPVYPDDIMCDNSLGVARAEAW